MRNLEQHEIDDVLHIEPTAYVAVVDGETPYVSPLSFVYSGGEIAFRTKEGRRLRALRANPRVAIVVTRTGASASDWKTVFVEGTASILSAHEITGRFVGQLMAKYRAAYGVDVPDWLSDRDAYVVVVDCSEMSGRGAGDTKPGRFEPS